MQQYWQERNKALEPGIQPLPEALLKSSEGNTVAWLAHLIDEYPCGSPPADAYQFVNGVVFGKLVQEVRCGSWPAEQPQYQSGGLIVMLLASSDVPFCPF